MSEEKVPSGGRDRRAVILAAAITAVVGAIATLTAALIGHQQGVNAASPRPTKTSIEYKVWASCPNTDKPMALIASEDPIVTPNPPSQIRGELGSAHIDNVIAPNGSARVGKQEKVCVTITRYPTSNHTLWLILRLRLPLKNPTYQLFYAVGEFSDPASGKYSVNIDRSCTAMPQGSRHTLVVVSADVMATRRLWDNYNARIYSKCNPAYDPRRHALPKGAFIVSNSGDVIQN
jgi:hypothetical protein